MRALQIRVTEDPLLIVRRSRRWKKHMVYILAANVSFKYDSGARSHIIYIGTTGKGGRRPATSAIDKASDAFYELRGVKEIRVYIATCKARKAVRTWPISWQRASRVRLCAICIQCTATTCAACRRTPQFGSAALTGTPGKHCVRMR